MKNIKLSILFSLVTILFTACNFFEGTILEVELPEHESQLAPYAFFQDTDTVLTVMVGKSVGVLDSINPEVVAFATVELYKNDNLLYVFEYVDSVKGYQVKLNEPFVSVENDEYELRVSAEGYETTSAKQIAPKKVTVLEASWDYGGGTSSFGDNVDNIDLRFQDPAGVENFYFIQGMTNKIRLDPNDSTIVVDVFRIPFALDSDDPNYENGIVSDFGFDGRIYNLRVQNYVRSFSFPPDPNERNTATVFFSSVTNEYATFVKSLSTFRNAQGNPFAEPVLLYSNMSGGLGAFGILRTVRIEL